MKITYIGFVFYLCVLWNDRVIAENNEVLYYEEVRIASRQYELVVRQNDLMHSEWNGSGEPPLSVEQATEIGRRALQEVYGDQTKRGLESISLISCFSHQAFYKIRFGIPKGLGRYSGTYITRTVIVFLDGSYLRPVGRPQK